MSQSQNATNSTSAGAALQTQLGELTVLPQTSLPGLKGTISKGRDREKDGRQGQGRGERRGGDSVLRRAEGREGRVSAPNLKTKLRIRPQIHLQLRHDRGSNRSSL